MASRTCYAGLLGIALVSALTVAACGGDNDNGGGPMATVAQPTVQPSATPDETPISTAGLTGITELDTVIEAIRSGDVEALRPLIAYTKFACGAMTEPGGPPLCEDNEQPGDLVDIFPLSVCEGEPLRPRAIDRALDFLAGTTFYAVFPAPQNEMYDSEYVAVVSGQNPDRTTVGWQVEITGGRIVALRLFCVGTPEQLIVAQGLTDPLLAP